MAYTRRYRDTDTQNFWPGFVDALSSVLLVVLFVLSVFMVGQFYLGSKVQHQEQSLAAQRQVLSQERKERDALMNKLQSASLTHAALKHELERSLTREEQLLVRMEKATMDHMSLQTALDNIKQEKQALHQELQEFRLNQAEVEGLLHMAKHRSLFLTHVSKAFEKVVGFRQQGDRFVFDANLLFDSGSATLTPKGKAQIQKVAQIMNTVQKDLPSDLSWILRIDGHTDAVPIHNQKFKSNWELSVARAMAVVKALQEAGLPAHRLAAAGFGEHHPVRVGAVNAENRRIEIRLDTM